MLGVWGRMLGRRRRVVTTLMALIMRLTQTHNTTSTRALMSRLYELQFENVVDYDCFSQAVF